MTKKLLLKIALAFLCFALGFLSCLFIVKSIPQEWDEEVEAKRLKQIDRINRLKESFNEDYERMVEWNKEVEDKIEEGK